MQVKRLYGCIHCVHKFGLNKKLLGYIVIIRVQYY